MGKALADLMEREFARSLRAGRSARRAAAIADLYTADCTFFEAGDQVTGREALNAKAGSILKDAPGFVFRAGRACASQSRSWPFAVGAARPGRSPAGLSRVRTLRSLSAENPSPVHVYR